MDLTASGRRRHEAKSMGLGPWGLSNFAAAIGIGLSGIDMTIRLRFALVFGAFEG
jgi:hypothetical protein